MVVLTFKWSGPRWWCRPTLTEGGSARPACRCASTTIRLCESAALSVCQRLKEHVVLARLLRPIRLKPSRLDSGQRALSYREGGGRWPVRPLVRGVLSRRIA